MKLARLLEKNEKYPEALEAYREALARYRKIGNTAQALEC